MNRKVLFSDGLSEEAQKLLEPHKTVFSSEIHDQLSRQDLLQKISEFEVLSIRTRTQVDEEVLRVGKKLKLVARAGTGTDHIDRDACEKLGIRVMNTASANSISAAELTVGLLLSVARHLTESSYHLKSGKWKQIRGIEIYRKVHGIIGLGRVGRLVATRLQAFGIQVIAADPYKTQTYADEIGVRIFSIEDVFKYSDFISLHTPLNKETRHFIDRKLLSATKPGGILINTARGGVVNEPAILAALKAGNLGAYASDVFESEPLPEKHPFLAHPQILLTPHIGAQTEEAQKRVNLAIASQIISYFETGDIENEVKLTD